MVEARTIFLSLAGAGVLAYAASGGLASLLHPQTTFESYYRNNAKKVAVYVHEASAKCESQLNEERSPLVQAITEKILLSILADYEGYKKIGNSEDYLNSGSNKQLTADVTMFKASVAKKPLREQATIIAELGDPKILKQLKECILVELTTKIKRDQN